MAKVMLTLNDTDVQFVVDALVEVRNEAASDQWFYELRANDQRIGEIAQGQWQVDADAAKALYDRTQSAINRIADSERPLAPGEGGCCAHIADLPDDAALTRAEEELYEAAVEYADCPEELRGTLERRTLTLAAEGYMKALREWSQEAEGAAGNPKALTMVCSGCGSEQSRWRGIPTMACVICGSRDYRLTPKRGTGCDG